MENRSEVVCIESKNLDHFTAGKIYKSSHISPPWPWMVMAWDNYGVGRYIHSGEYGEFKDLIPIIDKNNIIIGRVIKDA